MRIHSLCIAAFLIFAAPTTALAQQQEATDVLKEVRLLRQAIETIIATNIRVQIVFGRLQIQEQRTVRASQQLDLARQRTTDIIEEIAGFEDELKRQADAERQPQSSEETQMFATMKQLTQRQLARMQQSRTKALADEAEAANVLAQEQSQWSELNQQLEGLERLLRSRIPDR